MKIKDLFFKSSRFNQDKFQIKMCYFCLSVMGGKSPEIYISLKNDIYFVNRQSFQRNSNSIIRLSYTRIVYKGYLYFEISSYF